MKYKIISVLGFVIIILLSSCSTNRQMIYNTDFYTMDKVEKAKLLYCNQLDHENTGVVESAIMCLAKLKIRHPEENCSKALTKLNKLAIDGHTPCLRYKAHLTSILINDPRIVSENEQKVYSYDDAQFFNMLTAALNNKLLGYNQ